MTPEDEVLFAQAAYAAYGRSTGNKNYQGLEMPTWENLTPAIQTAWVAAALAAIEHVLIHVDVESKQTINTTYRP